MARKIAHQFEASQYKKSNNAVALQALLDGGLQRLHVQLRPEFEGHRLYGKSLRVLSFDDDGIRLAQDENVVLDYDDVVIPQAARPDFGRFDVFVKPVKNVSALLRRYPANDDWVRPVNTVIRDGNICVELPDSSDIAYPAQAFLWTFLPRVFDQNHYENASGMGKDTFTGNVKFAEAFAEKECIVEVSLPHIQHTKFYLYSVGHGTFRTVGANTVEEAKQLAAKK